MIGIILLFFEAARPLTNITFYKSFTSHLTMFALKFLPRPKGLHMEPSTMVDCLNKLSGQIRSCSTPGY